MVLSLVEEEEEVCVCFLGCIVWYLGVCLLFVWVCYILLLRSFNSSCFRARFLFNYLAMSYVVWLVFWNLV